MLRLRVVANVLVLGVLFGVVAGFAPPEPAIAKCHKAPVRQPYGEGKEESEWKSRADLELKFDGTIGSIIALCDCEPSHSPGCSRAQFESPVPRDAAVVGLDDSRGPPAPAV